jgi:hypothetical protein
MTDQYAKTVLGADQVLRHREVRINRIEYRDPNVEHSLAYFRRGNIRPAGYTRPAKNNF